MRFCPAILTVLFILIFSSCMSSSEAGFEAEPDWITSPPKEEGFYYGIGGSDTGDEAEDREIAISRAQSNLAASISVNVFSEFKLRNKVAADGSSTETLESRIQQSVSQSLTNLESVDSWYRPDRGYWVLVRMDKTEWENHRNADRRASIAPPSGLEENSGYNIPFLAALTNMNLPLQLLPGGIDTPFEITLDWIVSDYPVLDEFGGIHFSKLKGIVSFKQYGIVLVSREYGPEKEGGLTYEQARERAAIKVLETFTGDSSFKDQISMAMTE